MGTPCQGTNELFGLNYEADTVAKSRERMTAPALINPSNVSCWLPSQVVSSSGTHASCKLAKRTFSSNVEGLTNPPIPGATSNKCSPSVVPPTFVPFKRHANSVAGGS